MKTLFRRLYLASRTRMLSDAKHLTLSRRACILYVGFHVAMWCCVQALHIAVQRGSSSVITVLLDLGFPAHKRNSMGWTAAHDAAQRRDKPLTIRLLQAEVRKQRIMTCVANFLLELIKAAKSCHMDTVWNVTEQSRESREERKKCGHVGQAMLRNHRQTWIVRLYQTLTSDPICTRQGCKTHSNCTIHC